MKRNPFASTSSESANASSTSAELHNLSSLFSRKGDVAPTGQVFRSQTTNHGEPTSPTEEDVQTAHKNTWKVEDWFSAEKPQYLWDSVLKVSTEGILYLNLPLHVLKDRIEHRSSFPSVHEDHPKRLVTHVPRLNIVMMVVGTRGDVQPFIGIGLKLKAYGHRVRLASHKDYRQFVEQYGLEFYPLGGNPKVLSEYVVKHRGLMPSPSWNLAKEVAEQTQQLRDIVFSTWPACTEPDPEHPDKPFTAELIISNPVTYGHIHCAEKLQVPLHIVFTMPWTPTVEFPSPFCRVGVANMSSDHQPLSRYERTMDNLNANSNWTSYFFTEYMQWMGVRQIIMEFRTKTLGLKEWLRGRYASALNYAYNVRFTYIWSPSLVPQPRDWDSRRVRVVGFVDVKLGAIDKFQPPQKVLDFLNKGDPPVYIGFGSLVLDQPEKLTRWIVNAIDELGLRAIIQKGWGGLGAKLNPEAHDNVLIIDAMPHDWLFPRCRAVIHHGGAGTTACGLMNGKPTFIVPFFGDQPFWGDAVCAAGVGPAPVDVGSLSVKKIMDAIKVLLDPGVTARALELQKKMMQEDGAAGALASIHDHLLDTMNAKATAMHLAAEPSMDDRFEALVQDESLGLKHMLELHKPEPRLQDRAQVNEGIDDTQQEMDKSKDSKAGNPANPRLKGGAPRAAKAPAAGVKATSTTQVQPRSGLASKAATTPRDVKSPRDVTGHSARSKDADKFSLRKRSSPRPVANGVQSREVEQGMADDEEPVLSVRQTPLQSSETTSKSADAMDVAEVDHIAAPMTYSPELASQVEHATYIPSRINPVTGIPSYINTSHMGQAVSAPDGPAMKNADSELELAPKAASEPTSRSKDITVPQENKKSSSFPPTGSKAPSRWAKLRGKASAQGPNNRMNKKPWRADSEKLKDLLKTPMEYEQPWWARWAKFQCCTAPPKADQFGIVHVPDGKAKKEKKGKHKSQSSVEQIPSVSQPEQTTPQVPRPASTMVSPFAAPHMQHGWDNASSSSQEDTVNKPFHPSSIKIYNSPDAANTNSSGRSMKTGTPPEGAVAEVVSGAAVGTAVGTATDVKSPAVPRLGGIMEANAAVGSDRTKGSARGSGRRQWELKEREQERSKPATTDAAGLLDSGSSLELCLVPQPNRGGEGVFAAQGVMKDGGLAPPSLPLTATEEIFLTHNSDLSGLPDKPTAPVPGRDTTRASTGNPLAKAVTPDKLGGRDSGSAEHGLPRREIPLFPALVTGESSCSELDSARDDRPLSDRYRASGTSKIPKRPTDLIDKNSLRETDDTAHLKDTKALTSPHRTKTGSRSGATPSGKKPWTPVGGPSRVGRGDKSARDDDGLLDIAAHVMKPMEG